MPNLTVSRSHRWFSRIVLLSLCLILSGLAVRGPALAQGDNSNVKVVAQGGSVFFTPWDATPDPQGKVFYFTANGPQGSGVFSVATTGSANVKAIAVGSPFVMPLGIAVSTDGKRLYVADPWSAGADGNAIFAVPVEGGTPVAVAGTQGATPRGLEIVNEGGTDQIYFSGINLTDDQPTILKIAAAGGTPTVLSKGAPLVDPSGVAVAKDGTVYVLDRLAAGNGLGSVFRIKDNKLDKIADGIRTGSQMAGLTLTLDESLLLASSLDPKQGTAQVVVINLATMQTTIFNTVIGANHSAGGLHRAHSVNLFAWADVRGPKPGQIFEVQF